MTEGKRTRVPIEEYLNDPGKILREAKDVPHICVEDKEGRVVMTLVRQRTALCKDDDN